MAQKKASANSKPKQSKAETPKTADPVPVEEQTVDAMEAMVISQLVKDGVPYQEAKAQVQGGAPPQQPEEEPVDVEPPVTPAKSKDFSDGQVELHKEILAIHQGDGQGDYEINIKLPEYLFDWVGRRTLQTAGERNDPNFLIEQFLTVLLKEQRMLDPTKGGTITALSSGPRDSYNPVTEKWGS